MTDFMPQGEAAPGCPSVGRPAVAGAEARKTPTGCPVLAGAAAFRGDAAFSPRFALEGHAERQAAGAAGRTGTARIMARRTRGPASPRFEAVPIDHAATSGA